VLRSEHNFGRNWCSALIILGRHKTVLAFFLGCAALVTATACARNPAEVRRQREAAAARTPAVAPVAGALPCLTGLQSYRYSGNFSLTSPSGEARSQLGSLANLLKDVRFDGAAVGANASSLHVTFPGGASQDLQTIQFNGKHYQRAGDGKWEIATGGGQLLGALSTLDPQTLCSQTLATVNVSSLKPTEESLHGTPVDHYTLGPGDLANSTGLLGQRQRDPADQASATHLDVWTSRRDKYPMRIVVDSNFGAAGSQSTLHIDIDVTDANGKDISIKAPL
jgi:hypothetical protein